MKTAINTVLRDRWQEFARPVGTDGQLEIDWVGLQTQIEREIQRMLRRDLQSNPLLVFLMQTPDAPVREVSRDRRTAAIAL